MSRMEEKAKELHKREAHSITDKAADLDAIHDLDFGRDYKYTKDQKVYTVATYMITGNLTRTSQLTGISLPTVKNWKYNTEWWEECMSILRRVKNEELDVKLTAVIDQGVDELWDRLKNGDEVIQGGKPYRKRVSARDAATILGIVYDKRAMGRGDPTSRSESISVDELSKLAAAFKKVAQENSPKEKEIDGEVVSTQLVRTDNETNQ